MPFSTNGLRTGKNLPVKRHWLGWPESIPQPLPRHARRFHLVVGTHRDRSPPRRGEHRRRTHDRTFRRQGIFRIPQRCGSRSVRHDASAARLRSIPDRLQGPFGRPCKRAHLQSLQLPRNFPTGYPCDGQIVGNWKRTAGRGNVTIQTTLWVNAVPKALDAAVARYRSFIGGTKSENSPEAL